MNRLVNKAIAVSIFVFFTLLGMFLGVQSIAARFGYDTALGLPLMKLGGFWIYSPFKLFSWPSLLEPGSSALRVAYMWVLGGLGVGLALGVGVRLYRDGGVRKRTKDIFGDSSFATDQEVADMGLVGSGRGVFLGKLKNGKYIRHNGPEHYGVNAPTRSGKGAGVVIPTLLTWRGSCVVYDLKGENFLKTAGARSKFSNVFTFNPNTEDTAHFNPFFEIRPGVFEIRDAQNLANIIIEPESHGRTDHWILTARALTTASILHLMYAAPPGEKTMAGLAAHFSRIDKSFEQTLLDMKNTKHLRDASGRPDKPHPSIQALVQDVLNKADNDSKGVSSTLMSYLAIFRDPLLANATRDSDFTINDLVNNERPTSLYVVIPAADIERLRPIIRMLVIMICLRLTEAPVSDAVNKQHRHTLLLMLDEFAKLGRMEFFEQALGFLAGYGIQAMVVTQSLNELKQVYGERTSLFDNLHVQVFFRPETFEMARDLSAMLGNKTIEYTTTSQGGKKGALLYSNRNESSHIAPRALLLPREIQELPDEDAIILVGGKKPIRAKKVRYFDDGTLLNLIEPPPSTKRIGTKRIESPWLEARYLPPEDYEEVTTAENNDQVDVVGELIITQTEDPAKSTRKLPRRRQEANAATDETEEIA